MPQQQIARGYRITNGEVLTTVNSIINPDGVISYDYSVNSGVYNQIAALAVNYAKLQSLFIVSTQPVTLYFNGVNAVQSITIGGSPTGGTFTISYGGQTSAGIAYNASAATVQAALQAMSSIGAGNCTVTGSAGGPYTVTFTGTLGIQAITTITGSASGLTGGTPTIALASVTTGVAPAWNWVLPASWAINWAIGDIFSNPLGTTSITSIAISNPGSVSAVVNFRAGVSN